MLDTNIIKWNHPIEYLAEDLCLAISIPQQDVPSHLLIMYARFMHLGWIERYGRECIFLSELIRRILRIHGFSATMKEYVRTYSKEDRGWYTITGIEGLDDVVPYSNIATHAVCVSDGYILDWAAIDSIYRNFGAMSPWAFIGKDTEDWQQLKVHGQVKWHKRTPNRLVRNEKFKARERIIELTRHYFQLYQI